MTGFWKSLWLELLHLQTAAERKTDDSVGVEVYTARHPASGLAHLWRTIQRRVVRTGNRRSACCVDQSDVIGAQEVRYRHPLCQDLGG